MVKKIIQFILVLIFIALVVCGIVVGSYMLSQPARDGDSRKLINGVWYDDDENIKLQFRSDGQFQLANTKDKSVIADGYFKVDEDSKEIKLFLLPGHYNSDFEKAVKMKFFAKISYTDLYDPADEDKDSTDPETATFLIANTDYIYDCEMPEKLPDPYSNGKSFEDFK